MELLNLRESIERTETKEKEPYSWERIQQKLAAIKMQEETAEPRKKPGGDISPRSPIILQKF